MEAFFRQPIGIFSDLCYNNPSLIQRKRTHGETAEKAVRLGPPVVDFSGAMRTGILVFPVEQPLPSDRALYLSVGAAAGGV